jgi:hypothetical protein
MAHFLLVGFVATNIGPLGGNEMEKAKATYVFTYLALCLLTFAFVVMPASVWAATRNVTCSGTITSTLQSAINSSTNGDIVNIGAGSCTSGGLSWGDKNVTIQGAGKDVTTITLTGGLTIANTDTNHAAWRLTGMTLYSSGDPGTIITYWDNAGGASTRYGWRIDHVKFNFPSKSGYGVYINGPTFGLIDHCDFVQGTGLVINVEAWLSTETGAGVSTLHSAYLTSLPDAPGSNKAIYIEDCTFASAMGGGVAVFDTSNSAANVVFRYNTVTGAIFYSHWTRGNNINGGWYEIYKNKFTGNSNYNAYPIRFQGGGTGLIYSNTFSGYNDTYFLVGEPRGCDGEANAPLLSCNGSRSWDGNIEASGWPCLSQIGRGHGKTIAQIQAGSKQPSFPMYAWNNGTQAGCSTGGACTNTYNINSNCSTYVKATAHSNGDIDFCTGGTAQPASCGTHTLTYTPYTYPHPLQQGGGQDDGLTAPQNLRISQ